MANDDTLSQMLLFSVETINEFGPITGPSPLFHLKKRRGEGSRSIQATNTYALSTNELNKKITGMLNEEMPQGTVLSVNLTAPNGARSTGTQPLSTIPVDLVIEVSEVNEEGLPIVYLFQVAPDTHSVPMTTRVVIYTLTDE